ncbi:hypothetical protein EB796_003723 [Bugula neritina]|uniref:Uncharacterized protein n=1 Tax=Bugula neritina TaxID=10212 RepID=A0A7J7KJ70_BUGNE|nr:hypothetical protein EB796_003723 [Bugula neritina]
MRRHGDMQTVAFDVVKQTIMADDNYGVLEEQLPPIPISPDCEGVDSGTLNSLWEQEAMRLAQYIEKKSSNTEMTNESYANGESSLGEVFVSDEDEVPTGDLLQLDTPSSIKPNRAGVTQQLREMFGFENLPPPSSRPDRFAGVKGRLKGVTNSVGTYIHMGETHRGDDEGTKVSTGSKSLVVSELTESGVGDVSKPTGSDVRGVSKSTGSDVRGIRKSTESNVRGVSKSTGSDVRGIRKSTESNVRGVSKPTGSDVRGVSKSTGSDVRGIRKSTESNVRGVSKSTGSDVRGVSKSTENNVRGVSKSTESNVRGVSKSTESNVRGVSKSTESNVRGVSKSTGNSGFGESIKQKRKPLSEVVSNGSRCTLVSPAPSTNKVPRERAAKAAKSMSAAASSFKSRQSTRAVPGSKDSQSCDTGNAATSVTPRLKPLLAVSCKAMITPSRLKPLPRTTSAAPAGKPPARTLSATPAGKPPARTLSATPAGKPPARTLSATPAGKPPVRTLLATPAGKPPARTLLATPAGKPPARTLSATPAGKPPARTLSATPAGRSSTNHARHKATATAPNKVKAKSTS